VGESAETVGQRLARLRNERGLSQKEIAGPDVGHAYISRIEDGQRTPSLLRALRVLAGKLGVTLEHLETGREIPLALKREYQLATAELELRLGGSDPEAEQTLRELAAAEPRNRSGEHEQAIEQLEACGCRTISRALASWRLTVVG
jgi:transcriptional regulator with XRE-family HTH domain